MTPSLSLVLRLHAPPVDRADGPVAERFFAWIVESVLPTLQTLRGLPDGDGPVATLVISPLAAETWRDDAMRAGLDAALDAQVEAARSAERRDETRRLERVRTTWRGIGGDLSRAFAELQDAGRIELATTPATDACLPLIGERAFARPQIALAVSTHAKHFGRAPAGIDLTRGYSPRIDLLCAEYGLRWCLVGRVAFERATAKPLYGAWAPLCCPNSGVAAFMADPDAIGLPAAAPGRLHGTLLDRGLRDAPPSWHIALHPESLGEEPPRGRTIRADVFAEPWSAAEAEAAAEEVGRTWAETRLIEAGQAADAIGRAPHRVALFDGALFGRWWAGGHGFLKGALSGPGSTTPSRWLADHPEHQSAWPGLARAGATPGFAAAGDDPDREWLLDALPRAAARMNTVADRVAGTVAEVQAPARRAARALLLAQCGDWPLMIEHGLAGAEAVSGLRAHLSTFEAALADASKATDEQPSAVTVFDDLDLTPFASY